MPCFSARKGMRSGRAPSTLPRGAVAGLCCLAVPWLIPPGLGHAIILTYPPPQLLVGGAIAGGFEERREEFIKRREEGGVHEYIHT